MPWHGRMLDVDCTVPLCLGLWWEIWVGQVAFFMSKSLDFRPSIPNLHDFNPSLYAFFNFSRCLSKKPGCCGGHFVYSTWSLGPLYQWIKDHVLIPLVLGIFHGFFCLSRNELEDVRVEICSSMTKLHVFWVFKETASQGQFFISLFWGVASQQFRPQLKYNSARSFLQMICLSAAYFAACAV